MIAAATFHLESYDATRRRIIAETEAALELGLREGALLPRIPTVEVGHGGFDRRFADQFWRNVLDLDVETPRLVRILRTVRSIWNRGGERTTAPADCQFRSSI